MTSRGVTVRGLKYRLMDAWGDTIPNGFWVEGRPSYPVYVKRSEFRKIAGRAHSLFRMRCWVCERGEKELARTDSHLETAHIVYPAEPFTEIVDTDLTRSDVVLLCASHHLELDSWSRQGAWGDVESLREAVVNKLLAMKLDYDDKHGHESYDS